jgi:hypothetical protein
MITGGFAGWLVTASILFLINKSKKRGGRRGTAKRSGARRNAPQFTDQPKRPIRTYSTMSCPLPRVTEYTVVKGTQTSALIAQAASAQNPTYYFALNNFNVSTGFYDQYKIEAVRFTITPQNNAIGLFTTSTTSMVPIYCVIDYDDVAGLTNAALAAAYSTCVVINPGESCERIFKPHMAVAAYSGAFTSYANTAPMWIDAASNTVQHYGVKLYIPGATAAQTLLQGWDITIEAYIAFRKSI